MQTLTELLVLSGAGVVGESSRAIAWNDPVALMVAVTILRMTPGFGDTLTVYVQTSNDDENWATLTSQSFSSGVAYGTIGPVTPSAGALVRLRYDFTSITGDPCIVAAGLDYATMSGAASGGAPPVPPA